MSAEIPDLTTPRLILRALEITDAAAIQQRFPQWEIVRFLSSQVPWPYPADGALTYLRTWNYVSGRLASDIWEITREAWRQRRR